MGLSIITSPREIWKFGTHERADKRTPIVLFGQLVGAAGGARYSTMRLFRQSAGYVVSGSKTLICSRVIYMSDTAASRWSFLDGSSDIGLSSAVAPAGAVEVDAPFGIAQNVLVSTLANVTYAVDYYFEIPAARYLAIAAAAGIPIYWVVVFGHEV